MECAFMPRCAGRCALPGAFLTCRSKIYGNKITKKETRRMAIYHLSIKIISRGKGKSAVEAAAYRSGSALVSERDKETYDYTRKGGVVHTEILLPAHAPKEYADRAVLWNAVEKVEKQHNSQLAREIEIALPAELPIEQNVALARRFVNEQFVAAGMCADVCVHDKNDGNPHAHIMLTMRPINPDGTWGAKVIKVNGKKTYPVDWDDHSKAEEWRRSWAAYANGALRLADKLTEDNVLDHRSYERQGVEQIPTVHLGPYANGLEKRGIKTELGDKNREIAAMNSKLRQINARLKKLEAWKTDLLTAPPTLYEVFQNLYKYRRDLPDTQAQHIANIKLLADTMVFLDKYEIDTLDDMTAAMQKLRDKHNDLKLQHFNDSRRYGVLQDHIKHGENYGKRRAVYEKWQKMKEGSPQSDAYYKKHSEEITAFAAAHNYLTRVMNGNKSIPLVQWKREFAEIKSRYATANAEMDRLAKEIKSAETIKRNAEIVMGMESRKRSHGLEI
jgi:hypothetical protein